MNHEEQINNIKKQLQLKERTIQTSDANNQEHNQEHNNYSNQNTDNKDGICRWNHCHYVLDEGYGVR